MGLRGPLWGRLKYALLSTLNRLAHARESGPNVSAFWRRSVLGRGGEGAQRWIDQLCMLRSRATRNCSLPVSPKVRTRSRNSRYPRPSRISSGIHCTVRAAWESKKSSIPLFRHAKQVYRQHRLGASAERILLIPHTAGTLSAKAIVVITATTCKRLIDPGSVKKRPIWTSKV